MRGLYLLLLPALAGCWNGDQTALRLGDVSFGRQLIELKEARDAGAISAEDYETVRRAMIAAVTRLGKPPAEDSK
jgi:hypothetical protein